MKQGDSIKEMVRSKYSEIALQDKDVNAASCCGATPSCSGSEVYNIMADDYNELRGYKPEADLGLGCGRPSMQRSKQEMLWWILEAVPATIVLLPATNADRKVK
jgi:hypothetical protein